MKTGTKIVIALVAAAEVAQAINLTTRHEEPAEENSCFCLQAHGQPVYFPFGEEPYVTFTSLDGTDYRYPPNYGIGCEAHSAGLGPICDGDAPAGHCELDWCYVSAECEVSDRMPSIWGDDLFVSFLNCGNDLAGTFDNNAADEEADNGEDEVEEDDHDDDHLDDHEDGEEADNGEDEAEEDQHPDHTESGGEEGEADGQEEGAQEQGADGEEVEEAAEEEDDCAGPTGNNVDIVINFNVNVSNAAADDATVDTEVTEAAEGENVDITIEGDNEADEEEPVEGDNEADEEEPVDAGEDEVDMGPEDSKGGAGADEDEEADNGADAAEDNGAVVDGDEPAMNDDADEDDEVEPVVEPIVPDEPAVVEPVVPDEPAVVEPVCTEYDVAQTTAPSGRTFDISDGQTIENDFEFVPWGTYKENLNYPDYKSSSTYTQLFDQGYPESAAQVDASAAVYIGLFPQAKDWTGEFTNKYAAAEQSITREGTLSESTVVNCKTWGEWKAQISGDDEFITSDSVQSFLISMDYADSSEIDRIIFQALFAAEEAQEGDGVLDETASMVLTYTFWSYEEKM